VFRNNCKILQPSSRESKKIIFNFVKSKILNWDTMCEDYDKVLENKISGYCNSLNKKWSSSKCTLNVFRKYNEKWLNLNFNIALPPLHCKLSTS